MFSSPWLVVWYRWLYYPRKSGIIVSQYKDPYIQSGEWNVIRVLNAAHMVKRSVFWWGFRTRAPPRTQRRCFFQMFHHMLAQKDNISSSIKRSPHFFRWASHPISEVAWYLVMVFPPALHTTESTSSRPDMGFLDIGASLMIMKMILYPNAHFLKICEFLWGVGFRLPMCWVLLTPPKNSQFSRSINIDLQLQAKSDSIVTSGRERFSGDDFVVEWMSFWNTLPLHPGYKHKLH